MSAQKHSKRRYASDIRARKGGEKIVCLTAYSAPFAALADQHCDLILVGDSLGMVVYGLDSTLPVTLETMIAHTQAVMRGAAQACVILDMPFATYQESHEQAYRNAARALAETGCQGVKIEGGAEMAATVDFLVQRGIPVLGHVGLLPQHVQAMGGYKVQGRDKDGADAIAADAQAIAAAGAFALVVEGVKEGLAARITREVDIPIIGIGASPDCDGQVLVCDDMLGITPHAPKFVRRFGEIGQAMDKAVAEYAQAVRGGSFPGEDETY